MSLTKQAEVIYLYHSGFCVITAGHLLIFDFMKDPLSLLPAVFQESQERQVVVFASHSHGDHYSPTIFTWDNDIEYVLSHDIKHGEKSKKVAMVHPCCTYQVGALEVETLRSTDLGVAFLVRCDGITIYHAGDLNWWHWEGEPDEDNQAMAEDFKKQIHLLKGTAVDLAFVPVDPRLDTQYSWGLTHFMQVVGSNMVFPMHFGTDYTIFEKLQSELPIGTREHIVEITPTQYRFAYRK